MVKIEDIVKLTGHSGSKLVAGPIIVKVIKDCYKVDKTVFIGDETGSIQLNLQKGTDPLIRGGAILRFFSLRMESGHLHYTETSLVDTALKIAKKEVMELTAELEPYYTAEVLQRLLN